MTHSVHCILLQACFYDIMVMVVMLEKSATRGEHVKSKVETEKIRQTPHGS